MCRQTPREASPEVQAVSLLPSEVLRQAARAEVLELREGQTDRARARFSAAHVVRSEMSMGVAGRNLPRSARAVDRKGAAVHQVPQQAAKEDARRREVQARGSRTLLLVRRSKPGAAVVQGEGAARDRARADVSGRRRLHAMDAETQRCEAVASMQTRRAATQVRAMRAGAVDRAAETRTETGKAHLHPRWSDRPVRLVRVHQVASGESRTAGRHDEGEGGAV